MLAVSIIMLITSFKMALFGILRAAGTRMRVFLTNLILNFVIYCLLISFLPGEFAKGQQCKGYLYAYLATSSLSLLAYMLYISMINWHEQSMYRVQGMTHDQYFGNSREHVESDDSYTL